jgi:hypothetical protein
MMSRYLKNDTQALWKSLPPHRHPFAGRPDNGFDGAVGHATHAIARDLDNAEAGETGAGINAEDAHALTLAQS